MLKRRKEKEKRMKLNSLPYKRYWLPMSIIVTLLVSALAISSLMTFTAAEVNTTGTYFEVSPATITNSTFPQNVTIDIYVRNAPAGSHSWQIALSWGNTILKIREVLPGVLTPATGPIYPNLALAQLAGSIGIGESMMSVFTFSGDQKLCSVKFEVLATGKSALGLSNTLLADLSAVTTDYPNNDGFFRNQAVRDLAVTSVTPSASSVAEGGSVTITVVVKNEGNTTETNFDVKVYADVVTHDASDADTEEVGDEITIATYNVASLAPGISDTDATTVWTPVAIATEEYYISAEVVLGVDEDTHDNKLIDSTVKITEPNDLKVSSLNVPAEVYSREDVEIEFTVVNQGSSTETFNVTINANATLIGKVLVSSLASWDSKSDSLTWDTTGWARDRWDITASVPDLGEDAEDLADNSLTATIIVKPVQDIRIYGLALPTIDVWVAQTVNDIKVRLINDGTETETFDLYVYADAPQIALISSITLNAGQTKDIDVLHGYAGMAWDTTGSSRGSYVISAYVPPLPDEIGDDTVDNTYTGGSIYVRSLDGDINGDGWVDWKDLLLELVPNYNQHMP